MAGLLFAVPAKAPAATPALNRAENAGIPEGIPAEYLFYHRAFVPQALMFERPPESRCGITPRGGPDSGLTVSRPPPARTAPAAPGLESDSGVSR
jgi:hypothetical protein